MDDFDPSCKTRVNRPLFSTVTFLDGGKTESPVFAWSGNILMDLTNYQALKILPKTIDGNDYLFIESGGFGTRNKPGWRSPLYVLSLK